MAEPPTGAVTFLFTDIEGSTQLLRRLRERYGDVLAEHQRLLRASFARHGGYEVDTLPPLRPAAFFSAVVSVLDGFEHAVQVRDGELDVRVLADAANPADERGHGAQLRRSRARLPGLRC